jgi:hypothetical protein
MPKSPPCCTARRGIDCLSLRDSLFRELSGVATPTGIAAVIDIPQVPAELRRAMPCCWRRCRMPEMSARSCVPPPPQGCAMSCLVRAVPGHGPRACCAEGRVRIFRWPSASRSICLRRWQAAAATPVATVAHGGMSLYELDLGGPIFWLVGNEGAGLSAELVAAAKLRCHDSACRRYRIPECRGGHGSLPVRGEPPAIRQTITAAGYAERIVAAGATDGVRACGA